MSKLFIVLSLVILSFNLAGCGSPSSAKTKSIANVENHRTEAIQAYTEGDWNKAQRLFKRALVFYQGVDDQVNILFSHINLAEVALSLHDFKASQQHLNDAALIAKNQSLQQYQTRITLLNARLALQQNQLLKAEKLLQSILPVFDGVELLTVSDHTELASIATRTKIAFAQKQNETLWTQRYKNALSLAKEKNTVMQARLLRFQARLLLQTELYDEAEIKLQQALNLYKTDLSRIGIAMSLLELAEIYSLQQQWQNALEYYHRSNSVFRYLKDSDKIKKISQHIADLKLKMAEI